METVEPPVTPNHNETTATKGKIPLMQRLREFAERYGPLAFVVHWVIFFICLGTFMLLIRAGFQVEGAAGAAGTFAGAYLACQVIKIPRFAATFLLTPIIDRLIRKLRRQGPPPPTP